MRLHTTLEQVFAVEVDDERHELFGRLCRSPYFFLHYTQTAEAFMIEDVEVTIQGEGHGRKLIETIWRYCQLRKLDLYANFVLSEAVEFWLAMDFVPTEEDPTNYVRRYEPLAA